MMLAMFLASVSLPHFNLGWKNSNAAVKRNFRKSKAIGFAACSHASFPLHPTTIVTSQLENFGFASDKKSSVRMSAKAWITHEYTTLQPIFFANCKLCCTVEKQHTSLILTQSWYNIYIYIIISLNGSKWFHYVPFYLSNNHWYT